MKSFTWGLLITLAGSVFAVDRGPFDFGKEREWEFLGQGRFNGSLVKIENGKAYIRMADGVVREFQPGCAEGVGASHMQRAMCKLPANPARPDPAPGDAPLIDLDAKSLSAGPLAIWPNAGQLGGRFTAMNKPPVVTTIDGRKAVLFEHVPWLLPLEFQTMVSDFYMPEKLIGGTPLTVVAWLNNQGMPIDRETFLCWGEKDCSELGTPDFSYGTYDCMQWYNDRVRFPHSRFPKLGQWHQIAFVVTDDGKQNDLAVFVNGERVTNRRVARPPAKMLAENLVFLGCAWEAWWGHAWATRPARPFTGGIARLQVYSRALSESEIRKLGVTEGPFAPSPANGTFTATPTSKLSWSTGNSANSSFKVYLSLDKEAVTRGDASCLKATVEKPELDPGPLQAGQTYYWRVDQPGSETKVWSFTVASGGVAHPEPADQAKGTNPNLTALRWKPNPDGILQTVYFGTDKNAVANGTAASAEALGPNIDQVYIPIDLKLEKLACAQTYYWRVEQTTEGKKKEERKVLSPGEVWSFTTSDMDLEPDWPVSEPFPKAIRQDGFYSYYMENEGQPIISAGDNHDLHMRATRHALRKVMTKRPDINLALSANAAATHLASKLKPGWGWSLFVCASYGAGEPMLREGAILMHEMGHQYHMNGCEQREWDFRYRLGNVFDTNRSEGVWIGDYGGRNMWENMAVAASWWINDGVADAGGISSREALRRGDPRLFKLLSDYWPGDTLVELHPSKGLVTDANGTVTAWRNFAGSEYFKPGTGWRRYERSVDSFRAEGKPAVRTVAGVSAVAFNGSDALIADKAPQEALDGDRPWSVDLWVYREKEPAGDETLVSWGNGSQPAACLIWGSSAKAVECAGGASCSWVRKPRAGVWQRLAFVYNGSLNNEPNVCRVYVDGQADATATFKLELPAQPILRIGQGFTGAIAHVRVYDYALHPLQNENIQKIEAPWYQREPVQAGGAALLVDLDARMLAPCHDSEVWPFYPKVLERPWLRSWNNRGTLGGRIHNERLNNESTPLVQTVKGLTAIHFAGKDRMVSSFSDAPNGPATVEAWVCPDARGSTGTILQWGGINLNGQGLKPGEWQHVAAVIESGSATTYVNGAKAPATLVAKSAGDVRALHLGAAWDGKGWSNGFAGGIAQVRVHRGALTAQQLAANLAASDAMRPVSPSPAAGERVAINRKPALTWTTAVAAAGTKCDLYFGTDAAEIASATRTSPGFKGPQAPGAFKPELAPKTTYYWRVDPLNANGQASAQGPVWRFETTGGLLINLDASTLQAGPVKTWPNTGLAGGQFVPGSEKYSWRPTVEMVDGRKAVDFGVKGFLVSEAPAPNELLGKGPFTVSIRCYHRSVEGLPREQTMLSWGRLPKNNIEFCWGWNVKKGAFRDGNLELPFAGPVKEIPPSEPKKDDGQRIDPWRSNAPLLRGWRHIAYTYGGPGGKLRIYVDGKLNQEEAFSYELKPGDPICLGGALIADAPQTRFGGQLSEVAIADKELSAENIARLAQGATPASVLPAWLVLLDAQGLADGDLAKWPNAGSLGGTFGLLNEPDRAPVAQKVADRMGVTFDDGRTYLCSEQPTPAALTEDRPFTVDAVVLNPGFAESETVFCLAPVTAYKGYQYHGNNCGAFFCFGSGNQKGDRDLRPGLFTTQLNGRNLGWKEKHVTPNQWHRVTWVFSGGYNGVMRVYVDGQLEASMEYCNLYTNSGLPMYLGTAWNMARGPMRAFSGSLASLKVYDYAMTPEEVTAGK